VRRAGTEEHSGAQVPADGNVRQNDRNVDADRSGERNHSGGGAVSDALAGRCLARLGRVGVVVLVFRSGRIYWAGMKPLDGVSGDARSEKQERES
jgi:hypothetical protein